MRKAGLELRSAALEMDDLSLAHQGRTITGDSHIHEQTVTYLWLSIQN